MSATRSRRRKIISLLAVSALASGVGIAGYATGLLQRSELQTIDARFSIRGTRTAPRNIEFVAIDSATFPELEQHKLHSQFPFPREYEAKVIEQINEGGAKAISVDIEFTRSSNEKDDLALAEAIAGAHGKVVLGASRVGAHGETEIFGGAPALLHEIGARPAGWPTSTTTWGPSPGSPRK